MARADRDEKERARDTNAAAKPVILKKYGNRRLYDTRGSQYITLVEVETMLAQGDDVLVVDAKSGDDITKEVLVQIISEREGARDALPLGFLKEVVRVGRGPARRQFADAVSSTLSAVLDTQKRMASEMERAAQAYAQTPFMNPFGLFFRPPAHLHSPQTAPAVDEMATLRDELKATQALVRELAMAQREDRESDADAAASATENARSRGRSTAGSDVEKNAASAKKSRQPPRAARASSDGSRRRTPKKA